MVVAGGTELGGDVPRTPGADDEERSEESFHVATFLPTRRANCVILDGDTPSTSARSCGR